MNTDEKGVVMRKYKPLPSSFRVLAFLFLCGTVFLASLLLEGTTVFLSAVLFSILVGYLLFQKGINLFEPFTLFTLYYFTVPAAALHLHTSHFGEARFLHEVALSNDPDVLLRLALFYFIVGYVCALIGYKAFVRKAKPNIALNDGMSHKLVRLVIMGFSALALANFIFNIHFFAHGNIFTYFSNLSLRRQEFDESGGTTLGYVFGYIGAYLWYYTVLKDRRVSKLFLLYLLLTILMKASIGRIFQTLVYVTSFPVIYYIVNFHSLKHGKFSNVRYLLFGGVVGGVGVCLYFFRITTNIMFTNMDSAGWLETFLSYFEWSTIVTSAVDAGNIPNIPVFMKIIDSWGNDIEFLYGKSLFTPVMTVIPSSVRPEGYQVSVMIKDIWYPYTQGGALPPTGIGEMYANFGVLGPFVGMFIFGAFAAFVYNMLFKFNNYWYLVVYTKISLGFIMLYPKGEFDNFPLFEGLFILLVVAFIKHAQRVSRARGSRTGRV